VSEDSHNLERSLELAPYLHHQNFDDAFTLSLSTPILVGWGKVLSPHTEKNCEIIEDCGCASQQDWRALDQSANMPVNSSCEKAMR
jgi:hypothetical protein